MLRHTLIFSEIKKNKKKNTANHHPNFIQNDTIDKS